MFLAGVLCSIGAAAVNLAVFFISGQGEVDTTVAIIICSVVFGVIALPMLGFLIFHVYLSIRGKTTRELLKRLESSGKEEHENQWCDVDEPMWDPYMSIS